MSVCDLSHMGSSPEILCPELTAQRIVGASRAPWIFIATSDNNLYAMDWQRRPSCPVFLGRLDHSYAAVLECSEDGSTVIVASLGITTAWSRERKELLWRREGISPLCGAFHPNGKRFLCGLENGEVLELDARSGVTLRKPVTHTRWVNELAVSPNGTYLASIDLDDRLIVTDLVHGREVWSRYLRNFVPGMLPDPTVCPVFTPDGDFLIVSDLAHGQHITIIRSSDGKPMFSFPHSGARLKALAVTKQGELFAWDCDGIVTIWNISSRSKSGRFIPAQDHAYRL